VDDVEPRKTKEQIPQDPVKSLELPLFPVFSQVFPLQKSAAMAAMAEARGLRQRKVHLFLRGLGNEPLGLWIQWNINGIENGKK